MLARKKKELARFKRNGANIKVSKISSKVLYKNKTTSKIIFRNFGSTLRQKSCTRQNINIILRMLINRTLENADKVFLRKLN